MLPKALFDRLREGILARQRASAGTLLRAIKGDPEGLRRALAAG